MKLIRIALFSLLILSFFRLNAQESDHVGGELLVMLAPGVHPEKFAQKPIQAGSRPVFLTHKKVLSGRMNIHLYGFDPLLIPENVLLNTIRRSNEVLIAQFNHYIEAREGESCEATTPNDPNFGNQWALKNTGQMGGTPGADISAEDAWDIATGGLTSQGDTIVVAIIDGGVDLFHEDLLFWRNHDEIPGNNIDDDNNGFIDDYRGWNAYGSNGNVPSDNHGTHVSGIAAAHGNNGTGVSGVNWGAQVMPIAGSSGTESIVVEAYGYVFEMRKRYNETNGAMGAFVVSTNSSFGVNFGDPANFPLWCAMYDSMGAAGVLSAGATMNVAADVDVSSDIPTACPSPHMISVTNTNRNDLKNTGAAWGLTTIDLGAPGTDVLNTLPGDGYGSLTGTSMATPHVAGAIALLYAAACPDLISFYKSDPLNGALLFRDFLLMGVDTIPALQGLTVTGGRLNIFKSLQMVQDFCAGGSGCFTPFGLSASGLTDTTAVLGWSLVDSANSYIVQWKDVNSAIWMTDTVLTNALSLSGLSGCNAYEFMVQSVCDTSSSGFSTTYTFTTEGCCHAPAGISIVSVNETSALISWQPVFAADSFHVQYLNVGGGGLILPAVDTFLLITGLDSCTTYSVQVESICDTATSGYSPDVVFSTSGCGSCIDAPYCLSEGDDATEEWIDSVAIGPILNGSGTDNGYGNFLFQSNPAFGTGFPYPVYLKPGFGFFPFSEYWRIWIDLNSDGDFTDTGELVFDPGSASNAAVSGTMTIPATAVTGQTRMRVSMLFSDPPDPCGTLDFGEVEDYCIDILPGDSLCLNPYGMTLDSLMETLAVLSWNGPANASGYQIRYREAGNPVWNAGTVSSPTYFWAGLDSCTRYEFQARSLCANSDTSEWSATFSFSTTGCTDCSNIPYCVAAGQNSTEEWIASVSIGSINNISGNDNGYGNFTSLSTNVSRGQTYPLVLEPGFDGNSFPEFWKVWVDWNHDGDFMDLAELVYESPSGSDTVVTGNMLVPGNAPLGSARIRIAMKYNSPPADCESFQYGEVEDYCLNIQWATGIDPGLDPSAVNIYPNPAGDKLWVASDLEIRSIRIFNMLGQEVRFAIPQGSSRTGIELSGLPKGIYTLRAETREGVVAKKFVKE